MDAANGLFFPGKRLTALVVYIIVQVAGFKEILGFETAVRYHAAFQYQPYIDPKLHSQRNIQEFAVETP
jgi:hypothetical protein